MTQTAPLSEAIAFADELLRGCYGIDVRKVLDRPP
jgi:hypothetical protein